MNQNLGKLIQDAIKDGKLRSDATPFELKKFFCENKIIEDVEEVPEEVIDEDPEEITIDKHELLIEVVGVNKYRVEVRQDGENIESQEGNSYLVTNGSRVDISVINGRRSLVYTYQVESNRDLIFDFKKKEVVDRNDRI